MLGFETDFQYFQYFSATLHSIVKVSSHNYKDHLRNKLIIFLSILFYLLLNRTTSYIGLYFYKRAKFSIIKNLSQTFWFIK